MAQTAEVANAEGSSDQQISFSEGHWVLKDGYASGSLNGTWVYLSQETPIRHKMTFKASEILFEANLN